MIQIRQTADVSALRDMHKLTLPSDSLPDFYLGHWWLAYVGKMPIGFCGLHPSKQWCDTSYLVRAGVIPDYRGRGLQRRLVNVREQHARRAGVAWLISDTYRNPASSNSLIGCGFKIFIPSSPWGAKETIYWRKTLVTKDTHAP